MNERTVRQDSYRLFRELGLWPITQTDAQVCPRCGTIIKPPKGRPDILVLNPTGPGLVCEVKAVHGKSFPTNEITPEQRRWLDRWTGAGGLGLLALGTLVPRQRRLWLVPWLEWLEVEGQIKPYQKSIPVVAEPGMRRVIQENHLDLEHLLQPWELRQNNGWHLPENHILRR